ncbi:hypothetical protein FRC02_009394 [Tulasnella sp. 418]|nr:hypothetical protein FRC02_009394 [Tulasnella sp. 418]
MHLSSALLAIASTAFLTFTSAAPADPSLEPRRRDDVQGVEVSFLQSDHVDWRELKNKGKKFGYVLATAGEDYKSPYFETQYSGCRDAGLICGAYHAAVPSKRSGDDQAKYFVKNGGDWSKGDNKHLPGGLAIGYNPDDCYGLEPSELVKWIRDFSKKYHQLTGRYPVIGTSYKWWKTCTKNDSSFKSKNALWLIGSDDVPGGWDHWSFLEYTAPDTKTPGYVKWYNSASKLRDFAKGS